jgi:hypothetical protein
VIAIAWDKKNLRSLQNGLRNSLERKIDLKRRNHSKRTKRRLSAITAINTDTSNRNARSKMKKQRERRRHSKLHGMTQMNLKPTQLTIKQTSV